jgi:hypothetical protein
MPTPTYTPLATVTLGSSTSSLLFSSIPSSYRDLVLVIGGNTSATAEVQLRFNSDSGSNYFAVRGLGFTGGVYTDSNTSVTSTAAIASIGTSNNTVIQHIMDYSATDKHKNVLARSMIGTSDVVMGTARWASTSAITTINVLISTGTYSIGTVFSLYGIAA